MKWAIFIKKIAHFNLSKKSSQAFSDCASHAKHFAFGKMLLRPKSLEKSSLFCDGLLKCEAGLAPSRSPAVLLFSTKSIVFRQSQMGDLLAEFFHRKNTAAKNAAA